jgi:uncharacterized protein YjbI with pentapeptide repeats
MKEQSLNQEGQVIKAEDFSQKSLEGHVFTSCSFNRCDFSESIFYHTKFCSCTFINCKLSNPKLDGCRFQDVVFIECKIVGADFFKCEKTFFSTSFKNCFLHYCNFSDLNMKHASFNQSQLRENHFTNTLLNSADFTGANLAGSIFHNCDLSKADFSSAINYDINPQTNKIKKAKFTLPEAARLLQSFDIIII